MDDHTTTCRRSMSHAGRLSTPPGTGRAPRLPSPGPSASPSAWAAATSDWGLAPCEVPADPASWLESRIVELITAEAGPIVDDEPLTEGANACWTRTSRRTWRR